MRERIRETIQKYKYICKDRDREKQRWRMRKEHTGELAEVAWPEAQRKGKLSRRSPKGQRHGGRQRERRETEAERKSNEGRGEMS